MVAESSGGGTPMPASGESSPGQFVDFSAPAPRVISGTRTAVLRLPEISQNTWYGVVCILHSRRQLSVALMRLCTFLSSHQEVDPRNGRIVGRYGPDQDQVGGGMKFAEWYGQCYGLGKDQFWVDLRALRDLGLAERVVAPCNGRKAVYALALRVDIIPNGLPEDLARALKVWELPETEPTVAEGTTYGRLTGVQPGWTAPVEVEVDTRTAADLQAAPRWQHPAGSRTAAVAERLAKELRWVEADRRPDLRCIAVAPSGNSYNTRPQTSPLYASDSYLPGFVSDGSELLAWAKTIETTKRTPQGAAGATFGESVQVVSSRVLRRVYAAWRREFGRGRVFSRSGSFDESGDWQSDGRTPWADLHRVVGIALPRASEGELVELLSSNMAGVEDVVTVAGWRCWRLINARRDKHAYRPRRDKPAERVLSWDDNTEVERYRYSRQFAATWYGPVPPDPRAEQIRAERVAAEQAAAERRQAEEHKRAEVERRRAELAAAEAEKAEQYQRWGLLPAPGPADRRATLQFWLSLPEVERPQAPADRQAAAEERANIERGSGSGAPRPRKKHRTTEEVTELQRARWARLGIKPEEPTE